MKSNDLAFWSFCFSLLWRGYKNQFTQLVYTWYIIHVVVVQCCWSTVEHWGEAAARDDVTTSNPWQQHSVVFTYLCELTLWCVTHTKLTNHRRACSQSGSNSGQRREGGRGGRGGRWWQELGWGRLVSELWLPIGWSVVVCSTYDWSQNNNDVQISASAAVFVLSDLSSHL